MRELRIRVPGYVGPEVAFTDAAEVFAAFPYQNEPRHVVVCQRARAWLTKGISHMLGSSEPHVLIVEAGP